MNAPLRSGLARLAEAADAVAKVTAIPAVQVEKDFWITEVLRGVAAFGAEIGVTAVFKGGTSLSKAFGLIRRFSEDVDIVVVLPNPGGSSAHRHLVAFVEAAQSTTGLVATIDTESATRGVKRTAVFRYPTDAEIGALSAGVRLELGTRGGAIPMKRCSVTSLLCQYQSHIRSDLETLIGPAFDVHVQAPVRTLVEKLMILHHAAVSGDSKERWRHARHYYDVWCLLASEQAREALVASPADVLARDTLMHSAAADRRATSRPHEGFASSPAFDLSSSPGVVAVYEAVVLGQLLWPDSPQPTLEDCCELVHRHAGLL